MTTRTLRAGLAVIATAVVVVPATGAGTAGAAGKSADRFALLAKASPDECYGGVGASYVHKKSTKCPDGRQKKVNQAYVWGLTKSHSNLWLGTAPNTACLVMGEILRVFGSPSPIENDSFVCEYGESGYRQTLPDPAALEPRLGDWRPPKLYRYDLKEERLVGLRKQLEGADLGRLNGTLGIRSAGSLGRTVFFAGPTLSSGGIGQETTGLNIFAFDSKTDEFIASATLPEYSDIRRWISVDGELYTSVGKKAGGGLLLRWDGDPEAPGNAAHPSRSLFDFDVVGSLPAEGADLVEHEGRIYVTSWPIVGKDLVPAGVYQSPELGRHGLPASDAPMKEIWSVGDYEPDPLTARTYLGGAIASFDGKLVWGTIHGALAAGLLNALSYGTDPSSDQVVQGTHRPTAVFSAKNLESGEPQVRVLYGSAELPVYVPGTGWTVQPNKANQVPKFGDAGFDNPFNLYTWTMGVTDRGLYVGTQDFNYVSSKLAGETFSIDGFPITLPPINEQIAATQENPSLEYGGDLMLFKSMNKPAVSVSRTGVGNFANYGIRTMVADPDRLYMGTANPMNLIPEGGWELRRLGPP